MIRREVPSVRPSLAAFALVAVSFISLGNFQAEGARRLTRKLPKIEIQVSGPRSLKPSESLAIQQFTALVTNRSAEPFVFIVREGYLMNANWYWTVTDGKGLPIGMELVEHGFCGTPPYGAVAEEAASHLHDSDVLVLAPGESHEFPIPGGPSDDYVFPSAGVYRISATLTYVPPNASQYFDPYGKRHTASGFPTWDLSDLSISKLEAIQNSLSVQATSHPWSLMLPASRHPAGRKRSAAIFFR